MIILKKFSNITPIDRLRDQNLNFLLMKNGSIDSIDMETAIKMYSTENIFAYLSTKVVHSVEISDFTMEDYAGSVTLIVKFDCNLCFNDGLKGLLNELLANSFNESQWDSDLIFGKAFIRSIPNLRAWLYDRVGEVSAYLLKKHQAQALMTPDEFAQIKSMLPSYIDAEYIDIAAKFRSSGTNVNSERNETSVELARRYGLDLEIVNGLMNIYISISNVSSILEKADTACRNSGTSFKDVLGILMNCRTLAEAESRILEISNEFRCVLQFNQTYSSYGINDIDTARAEIANCDGNARAVEIWSCAVKIKKTFKTAKNKSFDSILKEVKLYGADETYGKYKKLDSRNLRYIILAVLIALAIAVVCFLFKPNYEQFSIQVEDLVASSKLEADFINYFGDKYSYEGNGLYVASLTKSQRLKFIDTLKSKGFKLYQSTSANNFILTDIGAVDEVMLLVDSSALAHNTECLKFASTILGETLNGSTKSVLFKNGVDSVISELNAKFIDAKLNNNKLILTVIDKTYMIESQNSKCADIFEAILNKNNIAFERKINSFKCKLSKENFDLINNTINNSEFSIYLKSTGSNSFLVLEPTLASYDLKIFIPSKEYFYKIQTQIKLLDDVQIEDSKLVEGGFGVMQAIFKLKSKLSAELVEESILSKVLSEYPNLKKSAFKISTN